MKAILLAMVALTAAGPVCAQTPLSDDELVAWATRTLDANNLGHADPLASSTYHGQPLSYVFGDFGMVLTIRYSLPSAVSCRSVDGVIRTYMIGDITAEKSEACVPRVLVERKLDQGVVVMGPQFTDDSLKAFAADFFRHLEYRKRLPVSVQQRVVGTYHGVWVRTSIACDVVGSAEPQCLQADAPLVVSLAETHGRDCLAEDGVRVRYEVPNEYKPFRQDVCVPKVLVESGMWKQTLTPGAKAELLTPAGKTAE